MPDSEIAALRPGDPARLGVYDVQGRLGEGGQGVVYLATGPSGEQVAIKWLRPDLVGDPMMKERFLREVAAAKRVAAFCTAQVIESGVEAERPYMISEYIDGPSLQQRVIASGPISGPALHRLAVGTATALAAIHQAGVVHRDLKPANVIMGPDGPRVIDFGIARALDSSATMTSRPVGTPAYMAPEQIMGQQVGPPADLFAWACTIIYATTGSSPFGSDTLPAVINRILNSTPSLGDLEGPLRDVVTSCLAKDPQVRPTAERVLLRLLQQSAPDPTTILEEAAAAAAGPPVPPPAWAAPPAHYTPPTLPYQAPSDPRAHQQAPSDPRAHQQAPPPDPRAAAHGGPYGPQSDPRAHQQAPSDPRAAAQGGPHSYPGRRPDPRAHQQAPPSDPRAAVPYPYPGAWPGAGSPGGPARPYPATLPGQYPPPPGLPPHVLNPGATQPAPRPKRFGLVAASVGVAVVVVVVVAAVALRNNTTITGAGGTSSPTPSETSSSPEPSPSDSPYPSPAPTPGATGVPTGDLTETKLPGISATIYENPADPVRLTYYEVEDKAKNLWINYPRSESDGRFKKTVKYWQQTISPDGTLAAGRTKNYTSDDYHGVDIINRATGGVTTVKTVKRPLTYEYGEWTKDSKRVLLSIRNPGGSTWTTKGFIVVDVASGTASVKRINDSSIKEGRFYWSGDGTMVATYYKNGTTKGIRFYDLDGNVVSTLSNVGEPYNTSSGLFSPSGDSIVTKCVDDGAKTCVWSASSGIETIRFSSDCTKVLGWWDEQHLFCWAGAVSGKTPVVVVDLRGTHVRTLLETTQSEDLGPYYSRRAVGTG